MTLPVPSAKVATCPAVDEPGPVTLPDPTGGMIPAPAGEFVSTIDQSACMPEPPVAITFTTSDVPLYEVTCASIALATFEVS